MPDEKTFEIGLVMAGAISAGAYTAGVMDFIIEALDAFEHAKAQNGWDGPTHSVRVPLMAGASAGGMTSAMVALQSFHDMEHVWPEQPPPAPEKNRLYSNWVSRIDLMRLLETSDLDGKEKDGVRSVLCCTILDEIVHETFDISGPATPRAWLGRGDDRTVRVLVTLTNLRGVPYSFEVHGAETIPYAMLNHGDYRDFKIGIGPTAVAGSLTLDVRQTNTPDWDSFRTAALATGAFPIGLAPRAITRPVADYDVSLRVGRDGPQFTTIKPDRIVADIDPFDFVSVDGGTIDNEPLEIARRFLQGSGPALVDNGEDARKAIILIAPFPSFLEKPEPFLGLRLTEVVPRMSTTLVQQSRFKADELARAADDTIFSRFLISPERDDNGSKEAKKYPIASGVLGGFGGFIDESFRRHDFLLGRRNAQGFLRYHFALPEEHPMFSDVKNRAAWYVEEPDAAGTKKKFAPRKDGEKESYGLPIIPLCGGLDVEIKIGPADLPKLPDAAKRSAMDKAIESRVEKVVEVLVDYDLQRFTSNPILGPVLRWGARQYLGQIAAKKGKEMIDGAIKEVAAAFKPSA